MHLCSGAPPRIPKRAKVFARIQLVDVLETGEAQTYLEMSREERREAPFSLCLQAVKDLFSQAKCSFSSARYADGARKTSIYEAARRSYMKARMLLENAHLASDEDAVSQRNHLVQCLANCAIINRRLHEFDRAVADCSRGLAESKHAKLYYHRGTIDLT